MKQFFSKLKKVNETALACLVILIGMFVVSIFYKPTDNNVFVTDTSAPFGANIVKKDDPQEECGKQMLNRLKQLPILVSFEDYSVKEIYKGKFTPLDLDSSFIAGRFKTTISQDLAKNEVNFAGHYVISEVGFTSVGSVLMVTDVINGKAYPFPYMDGNPYTGGFSYRKDSRLIIIDPVADDLDPSYLCHSRGNKNFRPYYFVWENNAFSLIGPKDGILPDVSYRMLP